MNDIEKAIAVLNRDIMHHQGQIDRNQEYGERYLKGEHQCIDCLKLAISALEQQLHNGWIPVTERLPKDFEPVLTCDKKGNRHIMTHYHEYEHPFCISPDHPRYFPPVAWQPLPKPYKEVDPDVG